METDAVARARTWWWIVLVLAAVLVPVAGAQGPSVASVSFHEPDDEHRFFHARIELEPGDAGYRVAAVDVDGHPEFFVAYVDGALTQYRPDGGVDRPRNGRIPAGRPATLVVRCPWEAGRTCTFSIDAHAEDEPRSSVLFTQAEAPATGGFPFPGWREHRVLVLREDDGIARHHDPYLFFLSDEADRVRSWTRELRMARHIEPEGRWEEIPSQVIYEKRRFDTPQHERAYATCQAAFLADVPAGGRARYLVAYGNPEAPAPEYPTDLTVDTSQSDGVRVANECYEIQVHHASGQINGFRSRLWALDGNPAFGFMDDRGYPLHYNPDIWVKNRSWTHTKGWNPPPKQSLVQGPVACVLRRWGHLPEAREIEVEVVYHFFSRTPYVLVESTMDVLQDVVANALRNEEVVFSPSTEVDHAGWKRPNGEMGYKPVVQEPGLTPGMIQVIEPDAPFVCLVRETDRLGMASIRLAQHAGSRGDAPPVIAATMTVLADYGWDFRYWSRSLVYPWGDHHPDRPAVLNAGTYYAERSAYCLFPLDDGPTPEQRLAHVDRLSERLRRPLRIDHQGAGPW